MEDLPPTYSEAVSKDPWKLIAPYLHREELRSLCLVSRAIRKATLPALWSCPNLHFGKDVADVYTALYQFTGCVDVATSEARHQVHTLNIINVAPTFVSWSAGQAAWLRNLLDNLPSLESLIVHESAVVNQEVVKRLSSGSTVPLNTAPTPHTWYLHLLSMTGLVNMSFDCLAAALSCFPQLVHLDLSYSNAAGKHLFIQQLCSARFILTLKILRLRGVGLGDRSVSSIAMCIGTGLWSLDVAENNLSDASVRSLLDHCLLPPDYADPPSCAEQTTGSTSDCAQDDQEANVLRQPSDCQRNTGLTHLRISDNDVSASAIIDLVKASRLVVLDCSRQKGLGVSGYYRGEPARDADQVVRVLKQLAEDKFSSAGSLKCLRINHQLVTGDCGLLDTLDKEKAAFFMRGGNRWPPWVTGDFHEPITDTALPTMGLRTLILTGIPYASKTGWIAKGLLAFTNHCAALEATAQEDAVKLRNNPKAPDLPNPRNGAESSTATDSEDSASSHETGVNVSQNQQSGADAGCPAYSSIPEAPADPAAEPLSQPDPSSPGDPQPAAEPQRPPNTPRLANTATALALPSSRTTLRSIYLEIDRPPPAELEAFDMHEATRDDFSFFDTVKTRQDPIVADEQPEENPWCGDLIQVLRARKALAKHVWSGDVFAVYK